MIRGPRFFQETPFHAGAGIVNSVRDVAQEEPGDREEDEGSLSRNT